MAFHAPGEIGDCIVSNDKAALLPMDHWTVPRNTTTGGVILDYGTV